jgi:hypothetical protein
MAHFAELDENNIVIKVHVACNIDIQNNGGELSEQAAQHFSTITPLSQNGVKYVQTSINDNFRKKYAYSGDYYDSIKDKFICKQPYPSWTLDSNDDWQAPIARPVTYLDNILDSENNLCPDLYDWNEESKTWQKRPV